MASAYVEKRRTASGIRWRVRYRLGGKDTALMFAGSFGKKGEALARRDWIISELAAMRAPDLRSLITEDDRPQLPTLTTALDAWRASRLDVDPQTANMHRSSAGRILKHAAHLADRSIDRITTEDVAALIATMAEAGYKRETLRKTRSALAMALDFYKLEPNPARDDRVKLPRERKAHIPPPLAEHVQKVLATVGRAYVLPIAVLDACGPRVSELEHATIGDLDEDRKAIRVRPDHEKNERYRWLHMPDDLFSALLATLPPREDRDPDARLFPECSDASVRMAIKRACTATGTPHFSPHGLRRRRGSLAYKQTHSLAEVAELLGDSKRVASEHYVYGLTDYAEVDRRASLARLFA